MIAFSAKYIIGSFFVLTCERNFFGVALEMFVLSVTLYLNIIEKYETQAQNMIAKYIKELPYAYQDMNEAFRVVRKVLEKQLTTRNIL